MIANQVFAEYLYHSYLYYKLHMPIIDDAEYDDLCKYLLVHWGEVSHRFRRLVTMEDLQAGTGFAIEYPLGMERVFRLHSGLKTVYITGSKPDTTIRQSMAYSYSGIKTFQNCPRQYYETKVLKKWPFPETEAIMYGKDVHKALEDYVGGVTDTLGAHSRFSGIADSIKAMQGEKLLEYEMGLDAQLNPCAFDDSNAYIRGIADGIVLDRAKGRAFIYDYKTGSDKYPDTAQLELMALMVFRHFPEVTTVKAALLFVVHDKIVQAEYHKKDAKPRWIQWLNKIEAIETANETGVWNESPSGLCGWCVVETCPHKTQPRKRR